MLTEHTKESIARAVVLVTEKHITQDEVHELLTALCEMAASDGALTAVRSVREALHE